MSFHLSMSGSGQGKDVDARDLLRETIEELREAGYAIHTASFSDERGHTDLSAVGDQGHSSDTADADAVESAEAATKPDAPAAK
jgi:hypothetical protein